MPHSTQNAAAAYASRKAEVDGLIADLQRHLITHGEKAASDPRNWGYPGDLGMIASLLKQTLGRED